MKTALFKAAAGVMLAAALAGCAIKPEPLNLPVATSTPAWREGAANDAWPAKDWWTAFGSTELDQLIARAEHDNDDLAAAVARMKEADAQARIAGAPLLPSVEAGTEAAAVRRNSPQGKERHYGDFTGVFTASYELDIWGKNHAALDAAKSSATAARYAWQVVDLATVSGVATTYIQVLGLQDQIATAQANLTTAETVLGDLQAKQRAGLVPKLDVVNQQALVETARQAIAPLQEAHAHALDALALLTGQSPETMQITSKSLADLHAPPLDAGLPSQLLLHRPDVQQAEQQLKAANANIVGRGPSSCPRSTCRARSGSRPWAWPRAWADRTCSTTWPWARCSRSSRAASSRASSSWPRRRRPNCWPTTSRPRAKPMATWKTPWPRCAPPRPSRAPARPPSPRPTRP
jgi:multidrug efflux system outer membrane protein